MTRSATKRKLVWTELAAHCQSKSPTTTTALHPPNSDGQQLRNFRGVPPLTLVPTETFVSMLNDNIRVRWPKLSHELVQLEHVLTLKGPQAQLLVPQHLVYPVAASMADLRNRGVHCEPILSSIRVDTAHSNKQIE